MDLGLSVRFYYADCWSRYTDRVTVPSGRYVIGFNATARVDVTSAAVAIDDVVLLEGSCDLQGIYNYHCILLPSPNPMPITEMTYIVSSGALNSTHSLTPQIFCDGHAPVIEKKSTVFRYYHDPLGLRLAN